MTADDLVDRELMFSRFQRLVIEVIRGGTKRTVFQTWEIEILVDIESCGLPHKRRASTLRHYLRTVRRQLDNGPGPPMKLSAFLAQRRSTRRPSSE